MLLLNEKYKLQKIMFKMIIFLEKGKMYVYISEIIDDFLSLCLFLASLYLL